MQINPMLAKASPEPFDDPAYIFEIKWDGERCVMFFENGRVVKLQNRKGTDITGQFPELSKITIRDHSAILDGEIVMFNGNGNVPSFNKLSQRTHLQDKRRIDMLSRVSPAYYVAFDILSINGVMVMDKPLRERKDMLAMVIPSWGERMGQSIFTSQSGTDFFRATVGQGHEGVMAKRLDSQYLEGKRSDAWLKVKPVKKSTCFVTGYTKGNGARESLGALHISEEINGQLVDRGRVGSGLSASSIYSLLNKFSEIGREGEIIKVNPSIKINVQFFEQTETGHYRFPVFRGEA